MILHVFQDWSDIEKRLGRPNKPLSEILARRAEIEARMKAVAASAQRHRENNQRPTTVNTYA